MRARARTASGIIPAYAGSTIKGLWDGIKSGDHPRIRGEHRCRWMAPTRSDGSSPHTRGAPQSLAQTGNAWRIIPAYAGGTRYVEMTLHKNGDHPRIRGEHVFQLMTKVPCPGSSPHTRGALRKTTTSASTTRIIPAYAGSTRRPRAITQRRWDHPRIRGEHDRGEALAVGPGGSSPHTRGAPRPLAPSPLGSRIIPAYAGSTRTYAAGGPPARDHPRIRGEHRLKRARGLVHEGSSPHTRGALGATGAAAGVPGIIPAYAGSTAYGSRCRAPSRDHPRIRGEHAAWMPSIIIASGSSPHTRGALQSASDVAAQEGIIPAYAGSTRRRRHSPGKPQGSSPHTRGARARTIATLLRSRIIPAYAGSTICFPFVKGLHWDHPRIRGEHRKGGRSLTINKGSSPHTRGAPAGSGEGPMSSRIIPAYAGSTSPLVAATLTPVGSSPHTRGAQPFGADAGIDCVGIIPAYAGSTLSCRSFRRRPWDHPRIRGEHAEVSTTRTFRTGSSPHTRGAPSATHISSRSWRIIPAYAGSTVDPTPESRQYWDHPRIRGEHLRRR